MFYCKAIAPQHYLIQCPVPICDLLHWKTSRWIISLFFFFSFQYLKLLPNCRQKSHKCIFFHYGEAFLRKSALAGLHEIYCSKSTRPVVVVVLNEILLVCKETEHILPPKMAWYFVKRPNCPQWSYGHWKRQSFSGQTDIRVVDNGAVICPRRLDHLSYLLSISAIFFHLGKNKLPLTLCVLYCIIRGTSMAISQQFDVRPTTITHKIRSMSLIYIRVYFIIHVYEFCNRETYRSNSGIVALML